MEFQRVNRDSERGPSANLPESAIGDRVTAIVESKANEVLEAIKEARSSSSTSSSHDAPENASELRDMLERTLGELGESLFDTLDAAAHSAAFRKDDPSRQLLDQLEQDLGPLPPLEVDTGKITFDAETIEETREQLDLLSHHASDLKRIAQAKLAVARLEIIPHQFDHLRLTKESENSLHLYSTARSALNSSLAAVGEDHPLSQHLKEVVDHESTAPQVMRLKEQSKIEPGQPAIEYTEKGFKVRFRLPTDIVGTYALPGGEEVRDYILSVTRNAEELCSREHLPGGPYDSSISKFSVQNSIGKKGPKVYDPSGTFRGRASTNTIASDSLTNSIGKFGSDIASSSIMKIFSSNPDPALLPELLHGEWTIVADQS